MRNEEQSNQGSGSGDSLDDDAVQEEAEKIIQTVVRGSPKRGEKESGGEDRQTGGGRRRPQSSPD